MADKDLDSNIRKALRSYSETPPPAIFSRIEETLANMEDMTPTVPARQRRLYRLYRYVSTAAAVLVAVGAVLYFGNRRGAEIVESSVGNALATLGNETALPHTQPQEGYPHSDGSPDMTAPRRVLPHPHSDSVPAFQGQKGRDEAMAGNREETYSSPPDSHRDEVAIAGKAESKEQTSTDIPDARNDTEESLGKRTQQYWDRLIAQDAALQKPSRRKGVSGSMYAGNFGTLQGDLRSSDPARAAHAGMLIKQSSDGGTVLDSGLQEDNGRPVLVPGQPATQDVSLRHRMPLNVGLTLSVPLSDRLALTTGVNYSYLYSSSTQSFTSGNASITRELHYLGVPIGLSYTFYRAGRFSFYMQGGGMVEKAVAWRETQSFSSGEDSGKEIVPLKVKGIQLSVNAAAGINCDLSRHLGLYIEPGLSYYFSQKDQPASYRTVHPTSFSLRIGIKFGI